MRFRLWNRQSVSEFSESWIRWLWLEGFDKSGLFRCQSSPGPPESCYFITVHVFPTEPLGEWRNLGLAFGKAKETALLKKQANFKGEGKPTLSMRWFPLSLRPSPLPFTDQGSTPGPPFSLRSSLTPTSAFAAFAISFCQRNCAFKKAGKIQGRGTLLRLVIPVLPTALCKSSRIRLTPNSWMVCRFPSWSVFPPLGAGGLCPDLA